MNIEPIWLQAGAAVLGALAAFTAAMYGVITRPLLKRMDDIRADLSQFKAETSAELRGIRDELKTQGERLTRVEERLPPSMIHH
jgi:type II secretory pathway component PulM